MEYTLFPVLFSLALPRERTASVAPVRSYSELSSASVRSAEHFSGNANATELSGVFPLGVPDVNKYPRVETRGISLSLKRQSVPRVERVVCTSPSRAYYRLASQDAPNRLPAATHSLAAAKAAVSFCLLLLATRERVIVFFHTYLVTHYIFL